MQHARKRPRGARSGFSLIELMIAVAIGGLVMGSMVQMLVANNRLYLLQVEAVTSQTSLRSAAALLVWELRQASSADGDLSNIDADGLTVRSIVGTGAICARSQSSAAFALTATAGDFSASSADSALVFARTGEWKAVQISSITESVGTITACAYADGRLPEAEVVLAVASPTDTADVTVGSPLHTFRSVEYGLFERDGRRWFGRRASGAASWETLAGPLEGASGLTFSYYDDAGATTTDPATVETVEIEIRTQSDHQIAGEYQTDTARFQVRLRN